MISQILLHSRMESAQLQRGQLERLASRRRQRQSLHVIFCAQLCTFLQVYTHTVRYWFVDVVASRCGGTLRTMTALGKAWFLAALGYGRLWTGSCASSLCREKKGSWQPCELAPKASRAGGGPLVPACGTRLCRDGYTISPRECLISGERGGPSAWAHSLRSRRRDPG